MSSLGIASTLFNPVLPHAPRSHAGGAGSADFSSSLALQLASFQTQSMSFLLGGSGDGLQAGGSPGILPGTAAAGDPLAVPGLGGGSSLPLAGLSPQGRNRSLFDPESAYRMMTEINNRDATYKAQFFELSQMQAEVTTLQQAATSLAAVAPSLDNAGIRSQLQAFAAEYNEWISRFDGSVQDGGLLAGTQAAEVSLHELRVSVENPFNGAMDGFHGLRDLGLSLDSGTHQVSVDTAKLDAALANNRQGAINTIREFGGNFARAAELLNSDHNFIPNRLDNLDRVIDYIADNRTSLQAEFGRGDPAKPSAQVAKALAAYQQMFGS